jgi:hypothetical protein
VRHTSPPLTFFRVCLKPSAVASINVYEELGNRQIIEKQKPENKRHDPNQKMAENSLIFYTN